MNKADTISDLECCLGARGDVFDVQRFSIHDGPGIRTTVFFKGCPLSCRWCHNPESHSSAPQLAFYPSKCIGCGRCLSACPNEAISMEEARIIRERCVVCGACAEACPTEALKIIGKKQSVEEILAVVMRDLPFYKTSNGGVTISGGEPTLQFDFLMCMLEVFRANGLHTAVETCGLVSPARLQELLENVDLILMDIKIIDPGKHAEMCGCDNVQILDSARAIAASGIDVVFRTPIIPEINDSEKDIRELGEFMLSLPNNPPLELMPYHKIGSGKYEALGLEYTLPEVDAPQNMPQLRKTLRNMGVNITGE